MCNCSQNTSIYNPCNVCNPTACTTNTDCDCPVKDLSTDCVLYTGEDLECTGIVNNTILTDVLLQLDTFICEMKEELMTMFSLANVGTGAKVYKGIDALGRKQLRTIIKTGDLITITENTNDIEISIDETALNDFLEDNQKTYSADNLGTGAEIFKDTTVVGDNTQFNFKSILIDEQSGLGESPIRDITANIDGLTVDIRTKKLNSTTLSITGTDEEITIDTPASAQIPAMYVNNLYQPTYEEWLAENSSQNGGVPIVGFEYIGLGTLAKPFTDTRVYTLGFPLTAPTITPDTSIQNALDGDLVHSFVGAGTKLSPNRIGEKIIVQNNSIGYTFNGNFSYSSLNLVAEGQIVCYNTGYLIDLDDSSSFDQTSSNFTIEIKENVIFQLIDSLGFRNSGNTGITPPSYDTGKIGIFLGDGTLYSSYNGVDNLTRYLFNGEGDNNDDGLHFQVKCRVRADFQGVYLCKNRMRIDFYNLIQSGVYLGSVNTALQAFRMTGGQVRFYEEGAISISSETSGRIYGITFEPEDDGIGYCAFQLASATVTGNCENCFAKLNNEHVSFLAFNSPSGAGFSTTIAGGITVVDGLFENLGVTPWSIDFRNNVFSYTGIDLTKVDLTQGNNGSALNFIGVNILETLKVYNSREQARASGNPPGTVFLNRQTVTAGAFVVGEEYKILTVGTTNYTLIGASANTVGFYFTATGAGTGTGTAYKYKRDILI